jgi:hypothetical protein
LPDQWKMAMKVTAVIHIFIQYPSLILSPYDHEIIRIK